MSKFILLMMVVALWSCGGGSSSNSPGNTSSSSSSSFSRSSMSEAKTSSAISSSSSAASRSSAAAQPLTLVPLPRQITDKKAKVEFGREVHLQTDPLAPTSALAAQQLLADLGITSVDKSTVSLQLSLVDQSDLGLEGYSLVIGSDIQIVAQTDAGLFYGIQTLKQLLPVNVQTTYELPQVEIVDVPQYAWRGSMVDVARNFFSIDYLKKHIERMAAFKLNKLHLHLSDDQGWRMEIKEYPLLTTIGGSTKVGGGLGGFYTQEELKELVSFASQHHIEIIPELDMPGHVQAAIASYNELACDDVTNLGLYTGTTVGFSSLCLTKPEVIYPFVETVLAEVASIFPSKYIHIGGDEIKNVLYPEFIDRANKIINDLGRTMVAWEEASAAQNLRSDTLLQLWNDNYDIQSALDRNIHLILSPCSYTYLDHGNFRGQPNTYTWCRQQGIPLERVYSFNPENYSLVAGIEAPVWSELVTTEAALDNRIWPRLAAVAEIAWSKQSDRKYSEFTVRLSGLKPHFDHWGVKYYPEPDLKW
jgi:hexosaminidase